MSSTRTPARVYLSVGCHPGGPDPRGRFCGRHHVITTVLSCVLTISDVQFYQFQRGLLGRGRGVRPATAAIRQREGLCDGTVPQSVLLAVRTVGYPAVQRAKRPSSPGQQESLRDYAVG